MGGKVSSNKDINILIQNYVLKALVNMFSSYLYLNWTAFENENSSQCYY